MIAQNNNTKNGGGDSKSNTLRSEYEHTDNSTAHLARIRGKHPNAQNLGPMSPINQKPGQLFYKVRFLCFSLNSALLDYKIDLCPCS